VYSTTNQTVITLIDNTNTSLIDNTNTSAASPPARHLLGERGALHAWAGAATHD
jgi:hypothetical protein